MPMHRHHVAGSALVATAVLVVGAAQAGCGSSTSTSSSSASATGTPGVLNSLENETIAVIQKASPSVVRIDTSSGLGSGIVYDDKGDVVTNAHVVGDATEMTVTASDGHQYPATLISSFVAGDLAVIKVNGASLQPAVFADSSKAVVGDFVIAMGSPLGFTASVTQGLVSALDRTVSEGGGVTLPDLIQTSAPINPGNSGGPLVDVTGAVIGVNTLAAVNGSSGTQAPGIAFAIPSNTVTDIAGQIVASGHVTNSGRAYLGVQLADATGTSGQSAGAYVVSVVPGGPADQAGIKPGDVIHSINGVSTPDLDAVSAALADLKPGQTVPVLLVRPDGTSATVNVTLGELPSQ